MSRKKWLSRVFSDDNEKADRADQTQSELGELTERDSDEETTEEATDESSGEDLNEKVTAATTESMDNTSTVDPDEGEEDTDDSGESESESDEEEIDFGTTTGRQSVQQTFSDTRSVILRVKASTYERVCGELGLDSEAAKPREVGQAVLDQDLDIREYVESNNNGV